jgi:hypothetical protein
MKHQNSLLATAAQSKINIFAGMCWPQNWRSVSGRLEGLTFLRASFGQAIAPCFFCSCISSVPGVLAFCVLAKGAQAAVSVSLGCGALQGLGQLPFSFLFFLFISSYSSLAGYFVLPAPFAYVYFPVLSQLLLTSCCNELSSIPLNALIEHLPFFVKKKTNSDSRPLMNHDLSFVQSIV